MEPTSGGGRVPSSATYKLPSISGWPKTFIETVSPGPNCMSGAGGGVWAVSRGGGGGAGGAAAACAKELSPVANSRISANWLIERNLLDENIGTEAYMIKQLRFYTSFPTARR